MIILMFTISDFYVLMFISTVIWLVKDFSQFLTTVMMLVFKKSTKELCLEEAFL